MKNAFLLPYLTYFLLFLPLLISSIPKREKSLRYVQAIWRHGDRAPKKKPYEADIYDEQYWPRGWNQLTLLGMQQMHELGQFLHDRYVGSFLSTQFNRKEIFIRSTAVDRAIESAQVLLSGMFPPSTKDQFDGEIQWQPIPVHSAIDGQSDLLLRPNSFACPNYIKLKKMVKEELEEQLMPKYKDLAENLRPILKIPEDQPVKFRSITELKSIQMEILHNLTQPDWVFKTWDKYGNRTTLDLVVELRDKERVAEFNGNNELARLSGGYLLGDWLKRIKRATNSTKNKAAVPQPQKMLLYSAHDGTLLALLSALQVKNIALKMPPFASCIIMEIYESKSDNKFFVELYYRQNGQLEPLVAGGCQKKECLLDHFLGNAEENAIFEAETLYDECGALRSMMAMSHSVRNAGLPTMTTLGLFLFSFFSIFIR